MFSSLNLIVRKIKSFKGRLPGGGYEKDALLYMFKIEMKVISLIALFLVLSIFINKYLIFISILLYPALCLAAISIPIILQEPGQVNRFQAFGYICFSYLFYLAIVLLVSLVAWNFVSFEIFFIGVAWCCIYSIYDTFKVISSRFK